jgi:hypothetical protein
MLKYKRIILATAPLIAAASFVVAQDSTNKAPAPSPDAKPVKTGTNAVAKASVSQADVASKTAKFGKVAKTDESYKNALDAHALDDAFKQVDKDGAFKGKVTKIFEPRGGALAIVNFDANYRSALTALLKKENFSNFPALTNLLAKEVMVSGKFTNYQGRAEIVLTNSAQIKLAE